MNTKLKPIPELDDLPDEKRGLLHDWIEHLGYRKTLEKLQSEWQLVVTYNKLFRYYHRHLKKSAFDNLLEDKLSTPDFLAILNGDAVPYDQSGIELIMKRAFDLTCARTIDPSTLATLLRVFHYKTNREWTQRRLAQNDQRIQIHDRLAKVREGELDLKKPDQTGEQDDYARAVKFTERVAEAFSLHPALQAIEAWNSSPSALTPNPTLDPNPNPSSPDSSQPSAGSSPTPAATLKSEISNLPYADAAPAIAPVYQSEKSASSAAPVEQSAIRNPQSAILQSHAIRRWRAYIPRRPCTPEPDDSWTDECPCGAPLPCTHHGSLWREVRYTKPSDPDYAAALTRVGIPFLRPASLSLPAT